MAVLTTKTHEKNEILKPKQTENNTMTRNVRALILGWVFDGCA